MEALRYLQQLIPFVVCIALPIALPFPAIYLISISFGLLARLLSLLRVPATSWLATKKINKYNHANEKVLNDEDNLEIWQCFKCIVFFFLASEAYTRKYLCNAVLMHFTFYCSRNFFVFSILTLLNIVKINIFILPLKTIQIPLM